MVWGNRWREGNIWQGGTGLGRERERGDEVGVGREVEEQMERRGKEMMDGRFMVREDGVKGIGKLRMKSSLRVNL